MERVITVKLGVDASESVAGLDQVDQGLKKVDADVNKLNQDASKLTLADKLAAINKEVNSGDLSFRQLTKKLQEYQSIALAAGANSPIGKQALTEAAGLKDRLDGLTMTVKNLSHDAAGMKAAFELGSGVLAGYTAFQGVTALLGVENEELQKTFVKLQGAQAAMMGIEKLHTLTRKESFIAMKAQELGTKAMAAAQKGYALAVGTSTGMMKLFRLALISTGIGAIIVGLGLLIANFDKVTAFVKKAIAEFGNLHDVLLILLGPIGWAILAYEKLFKTVEDNEGLAEKERKRREGQELQAHKDRLKRIDKEKNAKIAAADETIKALELEKDTLEAEGRASDEVTVKILEAELAKVTAVLDANRQKIDSQIEYYRNIAALRGQDEEEFKKSMLAQGVDLDNALQRANKILEENDAAVQYAENKITRFKREQGEKRAKDAQDIQKKILDAQIKANDAYLKLEELLTSLLLANMEDGAEKELAILMDKHDRERDAIIAQHGENSELLKQLDIKQENELEALHDKFEKERLKKEQEYTDQLIDLRLENLSEGKDKELELLKRKHAQELEEIRTKYGEQTELEKELLLKQKAELDAVEKEFDAQARQEKIDAANATLETIQGYLDQAAAINEALNEIGERKTARIEAQADNDLAILDKQKKQELSREGLTANQKLAIEQRFAMQEFNTKKKAAEATDKINKRTFQREKAFKLSQIAIDTAAAIVKALASSPPPLSFVNAGIAGAVGATQAAIVATQQFEGSAGSIQPPSFDAPSVGDGGGSGSGTSSGAGNQTDTTTSTGQFVGQGASKVVLSMVEVNQMQSDMLNIEDVATL